MRALGRAQVKPHDHRRRPAIGCVSTGP
jgi:hypothetical protein